MRVGGKGVFRGFPARRDRSWKGGRSHCFAGGYSSRNPQEKSSLQKGDFLCGSSLVRRERGSSGPSRHRQRGFPCWGGAMWGSRCRREMSSRKKRLSPLEIPRDPAGGFGFLRGGPKEKKPCLSLDFYYKERTLGEGHLSFSCWGEDLSIWLKNFTSSC